MSPSPRGQSIDSASPEDNSVLNWRDFRAFATEFQRGDSPGGGALFGVARYI
jgi:hypothetical protein